MKNRRFWATERLSTGTAALLLVLGWLILCAPWFVEGQTVPFDSKDQFYPFLQFVSQSLRSGDVPFWNPYVYSGYPMVSDPQSMMFSPIALVLMTIVESPSYRWFDAIEFLHLLIGGLGMLLLFVRLGHSQMAGLFAAAVYMFGGSASARMQHVPMIFAYGYFPFALLALHHALDTKRVRWGVCFGVVGGVMAAHLNQVAYLLSLVLVGYVLNIAFNSGSLLGFLKTRLWVLIAATLTTLVTIAVPLYSTLQFLSLSNRPSIPLETAVQNGLDPLMFLTLVARNFFDNAHPDTYWGFGDVTTTFLYAGTLPIIAILRYGIAAGMLLERRSRYFLLVAGLAVIYALGGLTPFYGLFYRFVFGVSLYRRPADATFVINMVLAFATGFVIDQLLAGSQGRMTRRLTAVALGAPAVLFVWGFRQAWVRDKLGLIARDLVFAVLFVAAALILLRVIARAQSNQTRFAWVFVSLVLTATDFRVHNSGTRLNAVDPRFVPLLTEESEDRDSLARFFAQSSPLADRTNPYRVEIVQAWTWANAPMVRKIQSTQGYNPLRYELYDRVAGSAESHVLPRSFGRLMPGYNSPLLNLLGVKYIASERLLTEIDPMVSVDRFPRVQDAEFKVWENPEALPRLLTATSVYIEPNIDNAIDQGKMANVDYRSTVVLPHLPESLTSHPAERQILLPGTGEVDARLTDYRNGEVTVAVRSERDVILVLNDLYYPYWRVYVDGRRQELLHANYLFRGVHVPPGSHRVVFRFEPFSWDAIQRTFARYRRSG